MTEQSKGRLLIAVHILASALFITVCFYKFDKQIALIFAFFMILITFIDIYLFKWFSAIVKVIKSLAGYVNENFDKTFNALKNISTGENLEINNAPPQKFEDGEAYKNLSNKVDFIIKYTSPISLGLLALLITMGLFVVAVAINKL